MNEIEYAKKINSILHNDEITKKYFQNYIIDLRSRLERWTDRTIRIGLIGVTSSGKSTLLNALLGDNILPTAVRPSSGSIIVCSKGSTTSAEIVFEDDRIEKVNEYNIVAALKKYGDEDLNKGNRYKVKEIRLKSRHFLLPNDVQIIDSPGLDAFGLERHDELTLSTLLPTIDLCLYTVTLKTNSDDTTRRILSQIHDLHKPMIIVQNMLDSIEPKLGRNGRVEKSRKMIADEHLARTKRILDAIDPKLHEIVQIVQVSAKRAVDGRRESNAQKIKESQIANLIQTVQSYQEKMGPQLFHTRGNNLKSFIQSILDEEKNLSGNRASFDQQIRQMELRLEENLNSSQEMQDILTRKRLELQKTLANFKSGISSAIQQIDNLRINDLLKAKSILSDIKARSSNIEDQFLQSMRTMNSEVTVFMDKLGFNLGEMIRSIAVRSTKQNAQNYFELKSTTKQRRVRVESSGFSGKTKRFFGSIFNKEWGYEYVNDSVEELDKPQMVRNLRLNKALTMRYPKS
ncbi:dynamin family protein [Neobacillus pocheonensis]|uniref:dynamin family protein n=1 Tax=Neobacillus pocheonensis TaxID=363869 RepID=UPI003D2B00DB